MIHTDGTPTIAHRANDDALSAAQNLTPHAHIRTLLADLVAAHADKEGFDADIALSRVDSLTFSFTDDNGSRWDVRVNRH